MEEAKESASDCIWSRRGVCRLRLGEAETPRAEAPPGHLLGKCDPGGACLIGLCWHAPHTVLDGSRGHVCSRDQPLSARATEDETWATACPPRGERTAPALLLFSHQVVPDSCDPTDCSTPGVLSPTVYLGLPKFMAIASVMPSNNLTLCRPLLLLPSILPSIRVFSNESAVHIKWPTYWSFSFSVSPSSEYLGLISFKTDWFDLAVQGIPHCSSSSSSLGRSINGDIMPALAGTSLKSAAYRDRTP